MLDDKKFKEGVFGLFQQRPYRENHYGVSELLYCPLKAFYCRKSGERSKPNGKMLHGILIHEKLEDMMKTSMPNESIEYEKECTHEIVTGSGDKIHIDGRCDGISGTHIYELKLTNSNPERYQTPPAYVLQANAYCHMLNRTNYALLTVFHPSLQVKVTEGVVDHLLFPSLVVRCTDLHEALKTDNSELLEGPRYYWECKFCGFQGSCKHSVVKKRSKKGN